METGKMLMVTLSGDPQYAEVEIDSTGYFNMYPLQVYENTEMVLKAENSKGRSNLSIDLVSEEYPEFSTMANSSTGTFYGNTAYRLEESYRRLEIDKAFKEIDSITYLEEIVITGDKEKETNPYRRAYKRNVTTLDLINDFPYANAYSNVFQLIQGRVTGVTIRGSIIDPEVFIRGMNSLTSNEPLYLIDGIPVSKEAILSTPLVNVESVDVLKGTAAAIFGARGMNGAIALNMKTGITTKSNRRTDVINLTNVGYYVSREFFSPDYSTEKEEHAKPDFRSTLYWNPEIRINFTGTADVSFYNADYITNYTVEIEGVTTKGVPLRATTQFDSK